MLHVKEDVKLYGLQPEALWAIDRVEEVFNHNGRHCTITSARGDSHSSHSHHYKGLAVDFRTRHLSETEKQKITRDVIHVLGTDYDVVLESNHLHIEYDPSRIEEYPS
jgi:hypothetical protein